MDYEQYDQWSENVRMEREEYVQEKLTAEEFQRKTNKPRELTSYEAGKIKLADGPSMWQQLVARDFRFDSGRYFPRESGENRPPKRQTQAATVRTVRAKLSGRRIGKWTTF